MSDGRHRRDYNPDGWGVGLAPLLAILLAMLLIGSGAFWLMFLVASH